MHPAIAAEYIKVLMATGRGKIYQGPRGQEQEEGKEVMPIPARDDRAAGMFDQIQKYCAELDSRIAAKGYKTAEVSVSVTEKRAVWIVRAAFRDFDYAGMRTFYSQAEAEEYIDNLPTAEEHRKTTVLEDFAKLQARAAAAGVELPS